MSAEAAYVVLTRDDAKLVFAQKDDESVRRIVNELRQCPKRRADELVLECGTDWDPIQRALTDGKLDTDFPLDHCVLGGRQMHKGDDFDAILIRPDIVPHVADALHELNREEFFESYMAIDPSDYGKEPSEVEADHVWCTLKLIRQMYDAAASEHAAVVFTVER